LSDQATIAPESPLCPMVSGVKFLGTGSYLPERVLTNFELETMVATSDEWIRTRTGISERRLAAPEQPTSELGALAAQRALDMAGMTPDDLDLIIVATITPDKPFPNTACFIQRRLGAHRAACFSVEAACSGFVYILDIAQAMLRAGPYRNALLVGAEKLSAIVNWQDRNTCVLFGDGAGAAILGRCPPEEDRFLRSALGSDGRYTDILHVPGGGTCQPLTAATMAEGAQYLKMSGQEVFKLAVTSMAAAATQVLRDAQMTVDQVRWLIPHQANTRIIEAVANRLGVPPERAFINLNKYGNTSAATIPIALDELVRAGQVAPGDHLLLVAFGGGLTWGASLWRW